jgi:hypothetical protein
MGRLTVCHVVIVAAVAASSCSGFKQAGSTRTGAGGQPSGGTGGAGGAAGHGGSGGGGAGGRGATGGSIPNIIIDASVSDGPVGPNPDANCGARSKTAMKVAPDILILLDRSGSMNDDVNNQMCRPDGGGAGAATGCGASSKWAQVAPAIMQVVSDTEADVNWGLKFFPDNSGNTCSVSTTAAVDVAPRNAASIATAIMGATSTNGGVVGYNGTPTRSAETGAVTYLQTLTDTGPKIILLATDGLPTCPASGMGASGDDSAAAPPAVAAALTAGFKPFVVGISTTGGGAADVTLSKMADAGGLPRAGMTPSYYPVSNTGDLAAAIRTLIGVAATCTFQIGPNPSTDGTTGLDHIDVLGDGNPISRDPSHANGYDYTDSTMQSIQVYGPLCDQIMSGAIKDVTVAFRCLVP